MLRPLSSFSARVIRGSGRGKDLGTPTINVDLQNVSKDLHEGIFACTVLIGDKTFDAAAHYGPRPVFKDIPSFELHILDGSPKDIPETVEITVIEKLRDVADFPSVEALQTQIVKDVAQAKVILKRYNAA